MTRSGCTSALAVLGLALALGGCGSGSKDKSSSTSATKSGGAGDTQYADPFAASKGPKAKSGSAAAARKQGVAALLLGKLAVTKNGEQVAASAPAVKAWAARYKLAAATARTELEKYAGASGWTLDGTGRFTRAQ